MAHGPPGVRIISFAVAVRAVFALLLSLFRACRRLFLLCLLALLYASVPRIASCATVLPENIHTLRFRIWLKERLKLRFLRLRLIYDMPDCRRI
jgi:hypothetical protein